MAINKNSNSFTFIFAIIMVVVVGTSLAMVFMGLKPFQDENIRKEKMQNILAAMNVDVDREEAQAKYEVALKEKIVLNNASQVVEGVDAFDIDALKQFRQWKAGARDQKTLEYPLFVCESEGKKLYVIPLVGTGLWGPIWGYVSVREDGKTINGSTFDHKGETPGLGAEITMDFFEDQFNGKSMVREGSNNPDDQYISVVKAGKAVGRNDAVDGITGGTITSNGVDEMLERTLAVYDKYFESL